jgi:hypothetical protein
LAKDGRIGYPGRSCGYNEGATSYNAGKIIPHMTSLVQCNFNATGPDTGNTAKANHDAKGLVSSFYDGHVAWIKIPIAVCVVYTDNRGNASSENKGIWPYVTWADSK